jgi:glc operon protein GlcG
MRIGSILTAATAAALFVAYTHTASAQQVITPYGAPITLDMAKKMVAAGEAEARKNNWPVVISIIDSGGHIVILQRMDNTQLGSIEIATGKAMTALKLRRPSKALQDAIAQGGAGLRMLAIYPGVTPLEGGMLIVVDGKIIGAVGVSGVLSEQDAQVAKAAIDGLGK